MARMTMKTILVINALNGSIPLVLREKYPSAKITCAEMFPFFKDHLTRLGLDVVDWRSVGLMKFDMVIGNPPFQKGLWKSFITQACELSNKYVYIVGPDTITQYSASKKVENFKEILVSNGIQSVQDVTHHFPGIQSGAIAAFMMDKTKPSNTQAFLKQGIQHKIVEKVLAHTKNGTLNAMLATQKANYGIHERSNVEMPGYTKIIHSVTNKGEIDFAWLKDYSNKVIDGNNYWFTNRFFGQSSNFALVEHNFEITLGQNITAIQKIPNMTLETFKQIYGSKLFRLVLSVMKNGKFDTPVAAIKRLPVVTSNELYDIIELTQDEIAYVEASVP